MLKKKIQYSNVNFLNWVRYGHTWAFDLLVPQRCPWEGTK